MSGATNAIIGSGNEATVNGDTTALAVVTIVGGESIITPRNIVRAAGALPLTVGVRRVPLLLGIVTSYVRNHIVSGDTIMVPRVTLLLKV